MQKTLEDDYHADAEPTAPEQTDNGASTQSRRDGRQDSPAAALEAIDVNAYPSTTDAIHAALATVPRWECPDCPTTKYQRPTTQCGKCGADGDDFDEVMP